MDNSQIFRPIVQQTPGRPEPTSGDAADLIRQAIFADVTDDAAETSRQVAQRLTAQPDPTNTGPCALKLSFFCTGAGYERLDPRDMLKPETSFRTPIVICLPCYEMAADIYVKEAHA